MTSEDRVGNLLELLLVFIVDNKNPKFIKHMLGNRGGEGRG
ncbi:MAG TPA: hypothetical protein VN704_05690 [Verrucomicrobiae bacterium]|nr:hypothetical protein [Verrucomicrobiae bacterium]